MNLLRLALVLLIILAAAASRPAPSQHDSPPESAIPGASLEATGNHAAPTRTEAPPKPTEGRWAAPSKTAGPKPVSSGPVASSHGSAAAVARPSARPRPTAKLVVPSRRSPMPECGKSSCTGRAPDPRYGVPWLTRSGVASHMGAGYPAGYLALPHGPGWKARICGAGECRTLVSNDAGPSLQMQREGRIADLSVALFEAICGVSYRMGLCPVSVTILGRVR